MKTSKCSPKRSIAVSQLCRLPSHHNSTGVNVHTVAVRKKPYKIGATYSRRTRWILWAVGLVWSTLAHPQFVFEKIADSETLFPGERTLDKFRAPSLEGPRAAFIGADSLLRYRAVYVYSRESGNFNLVADTTTEVPNTGGRSFSWFNGATGDPVSISGGIVTFNGASNADADTGGIYTSTSLVVADFTDSVPNGGNLGT